MAKIQMPQYTKTGVFQTATYGISNIS